MLGILVFGALAYQQLPVSDLPTVDFPTIQVQRVAARRQPRDDRLVGGAAAREAVRDDRRPDSRSTRRAQQGSTNITLQFDLSRNIDAAAQDVQAMIAKTARQLPPQMPAPPSYQKVNPGDQPVMFLVLRSATLPLSTINEYAETTIAQRISMVSGVAQVQVFGARALRRARRPRSAAARGVRHRHRRGRQRRFPTRTSNLPTGTIYGDDRTFTVLANGKLLRAAAYGPTIIAYRNGNPVRLDEVAHVYDGVENDKTAGWYNGERAICPGDSEAARHQRRRGGRRGARSCCRRSASSCRRRSRSTSAAIAPDRFASRCATSSSRCC